MSEMGNYAPVTVIQGSFTEGGKRYYQKTVVDAQGRETKVKTEIVDDASNADVFWFAPDERSRRVAAANDNQPYAWRGAPFRLLGATA